MEYNYMLLGCYPVVFKNWHNPVQSMKIDEERANVIHYVNHDFCQAPEGWDIVPYREDVGGITFIVEPEGRSADQYFAMFPKKRHQMRRCQKRMEQMGYTIRCVAVSDCSLTQLQRFYALITGTHQKNNSHDPMTQEAFMEYLHCVGEVYVAEYENHIIGFIGCDFGLIAHDHDPVYQDWWVYHNLVVACFRRALDRGEKIVNFGPSNSRFKTCLFGARPVFQRTQVGTHSKVVKWLLPIVAHQLREGFHGKTPTVGQSARACIWKGFGRQLRLSVSRLAACLPLDLDTKTGPLGRTA